MTPGQLQSLGIDRLAVGERLELVQAIWDSIAAEIERAPLTDCQKVEIDRRLAAHRANPQAAIPWEQVEAEALAKRHYAKCCTSFISSCTPKSLFLAAAVACPILFFIGIGLVYVAVERRNIYFASLGVMLICLVVNLAFLAISFLLGVIARRFRSSKYTWLTAGLMVVYSLLLGAIGH